ncbi:hypothetical protein F0562_035741 [Nyssa sinensis]|uniref:NADP-dependent oxidoreductase domain-containing protein n=1 Tax=Nyssa sinensis TaxID=561372 RepID=A0A5J5AF99_9ASTE|nr:hypothetical protein F0562_035741 [Nyssa sinensis]
MKKGSVGFKPENLTQPDIPRTWRAMEALYDSGKARAIGLSNFACSVSQEQWAQMSPFDTVQNVHPTLNTGSPWNS